MHARYLTERPDSLRDEHIQTLREVGWSDDEIVEINQVVSYYNYANRTMLQLGTSTHGDVLALSPNATDDPEIWRHKLVQAQEHPA